jgi:putative glutamine amidotransferase
VKLFGADRPLVVVTGPHRRLRFGWWATRFMLWLAGLRGHYMTAHRRDLPEGARGLIIGGGNDIEPEHYGLTGDAGATYDPERDAFEMEMVRWGLRDDLPILGICRGAQLINIVLGGSLHLDIRPLRQHTPNRNTVLPVKWADLVPDSALHAAVRHPALRINSLHNQAIDRTASELMVVARDRDGFIQAVEHRTGQYVLGVQWHPEYLPYSAPHRALFRAFAAAVERGTAVLRCHPRDAQA